MNQPTPNLNHIHKSDGSTADPSNVNCKLCGKRYIYDHNQQAKLKPIQSFNELIYAALVGYGIREPKLVERLNIKELTLAQSKQAITQAVKQLVRDAKPDKQDEHPTEDGVPVETYGYEAEHNQALDKYEAALLKALEQK